MDKKLETAINLSQEDWAEIYHALETKLQMVKMGLYGQTKAWPQQLKRIMRDLGPNAEIAIQVGVDPVDEDRVTFEPRKAEVLDLNNPLAGWKAVDDYPFDKRLKGRRS